MLPTLLCSTQRCPDLNPQPHVPNALYIFIYILYYTHYITLLITYTRRSCPKCSVAVIRISAFLELIHPELRCENRPSWAGSTIGPVVQMSSPKEHVTEAMACEMHINPIQILATPRRCKSSLFGISHGLIHCNQPIIQIRVTTLLHYSLN